MEAINYRLEKFEGPLDLLMTLIQKNKVSIEDIPISLICDQYMEYINAAAALDMELASEFIVMASELMLIKSKMLLPKAETDEEDPRFLLADKLIKYQQAKEAAKKMAALYPIYSGRMEKDTDEITIDKTFVTDQQVESLYLAVRRIITYNENRPKVEKSVFTPMISTPIVPVEVKIVEIISQMGQKEKTQLGELLDSATSLPDMIAIFLGVLELMKIRKIILCENEDDPFRSVYDINAQFALYDGEPDIVNASTQHTEGDEDGTEE